MEKGVLQRIPTQTILVHRSRTSWLDRRGDQPRKMEFSAALTNGFSSPALEWCPPYSTSFIFRPGAKECAGRSRRGQERKAPRTTFPSTAVASAVCFCDGLLVTRQNPAYMDYRVFYGIQDYAARQFGALPYVADRSVSHMEKLRLSHTPPEAARFWRGPSPSPTFPDAPPGAQAERERGAAEVNASILSPTPSYAPRVLFVHRTTRLIANATRYAAWMREAGFRVEEVYLEKLSAAQQYYLGRYADVVVAMHGLGIGHAMWMEREPYACRTIIEFRPWVIQSMPLQPLRVLGQSMKFSFLPLFPIDVQFGPSVTDPEKERELLLSFERVNSAFSFPSFTDQTAVFDDEEVRRTIFHVREHLNRCLPR